MRYSAMIKIGSCNRNAANILCSSLIPEIIKEKKLSNRDIYVDIKCRNDNTEIYIESNRISSLEALVGSYLNLIKIVFDVISSN